MKKLECVMMVLFFMVLMGCGWYLLDYCRESHENSQTYREVEAIAFSQDEESTEDEGETAQNASFDFQALLDQNADCIGWLNIPGTEINYPLVQGTDNSYYLHRNFYKQNASCGTLFLDYRNSLSSEGEHLILYGHQMKDGSMFKQLNGYKSESFYREHKNLILYLGQTKYQYEVAAAYVTNLGKSSDYYNYLHRETRKEQMDYLRGMAAYQIYATGVTVEEDDELLSLSTCEYSSKNGRLIVLARRTKGGTENGVE
jgi:sortase B